MALRSLQLSAIGGAKIWVELFSITLSTALLAGCAGRSPRMTSPPQPAPLQTLGAAKNHYVRPQNFIPFSTEASAGLSLSLAAVGDVMLGTWVTGYLERSGSTYPFEATKHILQAADFAIANLEAPFTDRGEPVKDKEFTFRVPPKHAIGLKESGFDVLHLANNHILDYGPEGLFDTISTLDSLALAHVGAGENLVAAYAPAIFERKGFDGKPLHCGFLGFSMTHPEEFYAGQTTPAPPSIYDRYLPRWIRWRPKWTSWWCRFIGAPKNGHTQTVSN
jgi:poly-gamma-glutamate synthesis protein (capsule biosynthesis protein)